MTAGQKKESSHGQINAPFRGTPRTKAETANTESTTFYYYYTGNVAKSQAILFGRDAAGNKKARTDRSARGYYDYASEIYCKTSKV